jgi:microcystin-dependent protein
LVYFKGTDQEWYKVDIDDSTTYVDKFVGLTQGAGTNGAAVNSGILLKGRDTTQTGLTAGSTYYASTSAGNISTTASAQTIGIAEDTNVLYFDLDFDDSFNRVPIGSINMYASTSAPTGWLLADGSAVSRTTYANLYNVIGTSYGTGNGTSTFNVPNLASRFPLGYSSTTPTKTLTFASRSSNVITITGVNSHANNELQTGQAVYYDTTGTVITGLSDATTYYVVRVSTTTFSLATSVSNANAGTVISLSGDGTGTQTFTITYTTRPLAQVGGTEYTAEVPSHTHTASFQANGSGFSSAGSNNTASGNVDITGGNTPNNMPPFTVVNYIIKI